MKNSDILLNRLAQSFLRGSLNISLKPEDVDLMTWGWQQKFLDTTVNSELLKRYPTSSTFSKLFFKKLINHLENNEIHDDIYKHLCESMEKDSNDDAFWYRHQVIGNNLSAIISTKETNKMVVNGTTGMRTWEAGLMLADWALCNKETFLNKTVLELGSGVGFTGVTIAKLCSPQSIYLTDCHTGVVKRICENIKINFPQIQKVNEEHTVFNNEDQTIGCMILDWNDLDDIPENIVPDIIIGADIVYDPIIIPPLCEIIQAFFSRNKLLCVYIASIIRNQDTFQTFLNSLGAINLRHKKLLLHESTYIEWDEHTERCLLQISC